MNLRNSTTNLKHPFIVYTERRIEQFTKMAKSLALPEKRINDQIKRINYALDHQFIKEYMMLKDALEKKFETELNFHETDIALSFLLNNLSTNYSVISNFLGCKIPRKIQSIIHQNYIDDLELKKLEILSQIESAQKLKNDTLSQMQETDE